MESLNLNRQRNKRRVVAWQMLVMFEDNVCVTQVTKPRATKFRVGQFQKKNPIRLMQRNTQYYEHDQKK